MGQPRGDRPRVPIRIEEALAAAAIGLIALISFANVVVRYLTNVSFAFTEEYSVFLLVFMTFVGASLAFATDGHVRIAFFEQRLPPALRLACRTVALAATLLILGMVLWYGAVLTWDQWRWEETSPGLGNPQWIYTVWLPLLALACILRVAGRAWRTGLRDP
jgi:TRAP-type C4-dicarboxylate transport system permease small subunit